MSPHLRARAVLLALAALLVTAALLPPLDRIPVGNTQPSGEGDGALFATVVARVRAGEAYYPVMDSELTKRNYPVSSVFNWRTPALYELMALAPPLVSRVALVALSLAALALTVLHMNCLRATEEVIAGVLVQIGALCVILAPAVGLQTEAWAGILMVISALLYAQGRWQAPSLIGIAALFVRELAAPYCVVCVLLAARARRVRELMIWGVGGTAYAAFYSWHVLQVNMQQHAGTQGHIATWIKFGGLRFLMETTRESNSVLLLTPYLFSACFMALLAAALWAPTIPPHIKSAVVAYAVFFAVVGQSFNDYWGLAIAPVQAVALAYGPFGLRALTRTAWRSSGVSVSDSRATG